MAQVFDRSFNTISKVSISALVILVVVFFAKGNVFVRSPYLTGVRVAIDQPVPFSHKHHVSDVGLDCRYCHGSVEDSSFAGIPSTHTCMTCHSQIWSEAPMLEPVRESYRDNKPLVWNRVHNLADFVYFNHSIHVTKGIACTTCHGDVDQMPLTWREHTLQMSWCLDCHRHPGNFVQPKETVFEPGWTAGAHGDADAQTLRKELMNQYKIKTPQLTNCSVCHR